MANLLIRDIPDDVVEELKQRAKFHNRPLQRELRGILLETARRPCGDQAEAIQRTPVIYRQRRIAAGGP
jgi:plasmid stability protein